VLLPGHFDIMSEADKLHALTEAMSAMSVAYFTGNVNRSRLNPKLRAFFERIAEFMRAVVARSIKIKQAQAAGAISADFESFLARSVGLDFDQTIEVKAHAAMGSYAGVASGQTIGQTTYSISAHADEFSEDLRKQAEFLDRSAKARGFADANVMAAEAPEAFSELSKQWRIFHQRLAKSGELRNNAQSDEIDRTLYGSALDGLPHSSANALDAAQAYLGTSDGAGGTAQGGESGKSQIVEWARESGRLVSKIPWRLDGKRDVGQGEHHVFFDKKSGRWVKLTRGNGGQYGITLDLRGRKWSIGRATVWQYLARLVLQNQTFGDDIRLHGVYLDKHGNVNIITSQPDVAGGEATMAQMETAFKGAGFVSLGDGAWYRAADNLMLVDMHDQNAVILDGQVIVFDASALNPSKDQLDALRKQGVKIPESSGNAQTLSITPINAVTVEEESAATEDAIKDFERELSKPQQERLRRVAAVQFARVEKENAEILRAHDEDGRPLPAPNGKPSNLNRRQWIQVRTPLFKRWFGDWEALARGENVNPDSVSKVVDENGEPMVVYHGSKVPGLTEFKRSKIGFGLVGNSNTAFWFSSSRTGAEYFADFDGVHDDSDFVTQAFLSIKKPLRLDGIVPRRNEFQRAFGEGRDGIIAQGVTDGDTYGTVYALFAPNQIKSATANEGMFSESGNITLSIAPVQAAAEVEGFLAALDKDPALRRERVAAALSRVKAIKREAGRGNGVKPLARARCEPKMRRGLYDFP